MRFPIKLDIGFIFDLRYIPFILTALYAGYKYTFPIYIVLNIYRFMIGGEGSLQSLIFSSVIFLLVPVFKKMFLNFNKKKRISTAVMVSILTMVLYLLSLAAIIPSLNREFWVLTINALSTYALVMLVIIILIEQIIANMNTREALIQAERFNVLSDLSASVAHEIRNPLTVTNGFLQLLNQSKKVTGDEKKYIEFSLLELNRAESIVNDFLAFAKPQSENMIYSNLKDETEYVKNIIIPYANMHQVDVQLRFNNHLNVKYDKNQIHQCFINLFKNAIEAMREKGGVLSIDVSEQKNNILIKIKDTGCGMKEEEILRLGKPYYSTKNEGTGLGMLVVYSTINKLNGKIEVDSESGRGTTFILSIPS